MRDGLLTGLFLALQTLSSFYYGIFFATYLIPVGIALLDRRAIAPRFWPVVRALACGAVLAAVLVVPFTRPYFAARQSVGERPLSRGRVLQREAAGLPRRASAQHVVRPVLAGEGSQERELFEGFVVPALALAALWPPISAARMGYGVGLALAFELSLGTNGIVYPWLREHVAAVPRPARARANGDRRRAVAGDSRRLRRRADLAGGELTRRARSRRSS